MSHILIKGGYVVTLEDANPEIADGDILVENDRIAAIDRNLPAPEGVEVIDAQGMIVMPGFVNAHIHTWQTSLRGMAGDWTATNYFRAMHAGLATFFKPDDIYIANLVGALNQLNCGATTIIDWHHNNPTPAHSDAAIDGLEEAGIRAVFLHGSPKPDPKPGERPYAERPMPRSEVVRLRKGRLASDDGLVTLGLAILGPQMSVHDVTMADFRLAHELGLVASMHHSGRAMPAPDAFRKAAEEGLIDDTINIVHGNELTDDDLDILAQNGATFVVTSEVEMQMAYTDPLTGRLRRYGVPVAIGSDIESAFSADMFTVMRVTLQAERHLTSMREMAKTGERPHPTPITTREALRWATINGAHIYRLAQRTGSLAIGKQADVIMIRRNDLNMVAAADLVNAIVMHANPGNVDTVIVAGRIMKRGGKLLASRIGEKAATLIESGNRIRQEFKEKSPTAAYA